MRHTDKPMLYPWGALMLSIAVYLTPYPEVERYEVTQGSVVIPVKYNSGKLCLMDTKPKWPVMDFNVCYTTERR